MVSFVDRGVDRRLPPTTEVLSLTHKSYSRSRRTETERCEAVLGIGDRIWMMMDSYVTWISLDGFDPSFARPTLEISVLPTDWCSLAMNWAVHLSSPSTLLAGTGPPESLHTDFAIMTAWSQTRSSPLTIRHNENRREYAVRMRTGEASRRVPIGEHRCVVQRRIRAIPETGFVIVNNV